MLKTILKACFFLIPFLLFYSPPLEAIVVANKVEVHLSIEDSAMPHVTVTSVKFNDEEVDLAPKSFMNRRISKVFKLLPGQYEIQWTTQKAGDAWGGEKETKQHQRMIIIEISDAVVYINVRGEVLATY
ncbi:MULTISPECIES: hypothetical protein [unclassified Neochlamydia]|uniref:hypothetical protein n=1 Tax=unclassified Neochlamydia TaxID=2643326 RepID=UPI00140904E8|nr:MULTISPECIES: hypothetical protein [unclassified Neochlamydia]MBS4171014.1 Uncharacterized protein [Neochlamydia sp. AcF95]NGY94655.1 hypothetical protein [Neochlamydia sp. AcF84]